MELTTLPDDALLQVLRYLDTRQLLQCRRVCRRLRDAALHPDLWRKRRLALSWEQDDDVPLVSAALRLAPCLGRLSLDADFLEELFEVELPGGSLLASTSCAVSELDFELYSSDAGFVASAIARQTALGRLNSVSLWLDKTTPEVRMLLNHLLHTQGLTSLNLWVDTPDSMDWQWGDAVPSSLQRLQYGWPGGPLSPLLQWHADTLQVVDLQSQLPAGTAALLVTLPNLRELKCPVLDDMPALLQCSGLATLYLCVSGADEVPRLRSAQQYLRQAVAASLETITLDYDLQEEEVPESKVCEDALSLVQCLAGPDDGGAPSLLRSLKLSYNEWMDAEEPQPQLPLLASVLHRLPRLVSLDLGGPHTTAFLEAMDGQVLPRLERLCVAGLLGCGGCPHEWAHGQEPRGLLMRYPRLHVELRSEHNAIPCRYCRGNSCHNFKGNTDHTLFSHPEHDGQCKQGHRGTDIRIVL